MKLEGIHHVSCITGDARANLEFYTDVMGLRLVAKSVNQDDPNVYHLFYADEEGHPGSDLTFFEYPGARRGRAGRGMVYKVTFRVGSAGALDFWEERLVARGLAVEREADGLRFADPEGLGLELVVSEEDESLIATHPQIPSEFALRGFDAVSAYGAPSEAARYVLEEVMGASALGSDVWELRGHRRGATVSYTPEPPEPGVPGSGTVHHVAWHTTVAEHGQWLERLRTMGVQSTPIIDRHWFHSIYFREPTGVLFEIADDGPGFTVDAPVPDLGRRVVLPDFLEDRRAQIEAVLTPLPDPRAEWPEHTPTG